MGYESLLPVPLATLASAAALSFLLTDVELNRGIRQLWCVGPRDRAAEAYLRANAKVPVEFTLEVPPGADLSDTLVFLREAAVSESDPGDLLRRNARVILESDLMAKFGL
jgi:hypothetical protein